MSAPDDQVASVAPYPYSALAKLGPFRRLWAGDLASQSGDRMAFVAITVLAYSGGADAMGLALVIGAYFAPAIVLGLPGGLAADRLPRRTMMVAAEGARAAIAVSIGLLGEGWWLLPLILAFSSLTCLFYPARQAAIACLVPARALLVANAAISANLIIGFAVGPALGGALVALADERWALLAASAVMLLDVALVASIHEPGVCRASATPGASLGTILREGLASVRSYAVLWQGLAVIAFIMLAVGGGAVGLVVLGDEGLGMGDGGFSVLLSALGAGTFAGALAIGVRKPGSPKGTLVVAAPLLAGALLIGLPLAPSVAVALLVMVALGFACAMVLVPFTTMLQERMGDHVMGTSFGVLNTALTTPMVIGVAVAGPMLDELGVQELFVALGVLLLAGGVVAILASELWGS